jgi:hypothetical protein
MKKIFLSICILFSTILSFAQVTFSVDTSFSDWGRLTNADPEIIMQNNTNSTYIYHWNAVPANCIFPTGYQISGICTTPGLCYSYNANSHTDSIPAGAKQKIHPSVYLDATARIDSACIVVINTDINGGKQLTFVINAHNWATSLSTVNKKNHLEMYPLPASDKLHVIHNNTKVAKAVVFNMLGKKIGEYTTPINTNEFNISVANLPDGMYIIDVRDSNNLSLATQRFSKN